MTILQVQAMLDQAYGEFEDRFEEKRLTPVWNLPAEPVMIEADGRQFWRVLENLFGESMQICKREQQLFCHGKDRSGTGHHHRRKYGEGGTACFSGGSHGTLCTGRPQPKYGGQRARSFDCQKPYRAAGRRLFPAGIRRPVCSDHYLPAKRKAAEA